MLDEGLGAGDASFIEKANARLLRLAEAAGIVVVATHSEELLRKTCKMAALMEAGRILATGTVEEVLKLYHTSLAA
jgi:ABC-type polysaccharide/polyol phosphate transport system ATPase subunit